ncbi:GMC family oxidoreductase [Rhodothermaceae bacterium RA]|nr:GMC family oxidoreductase [Rhodothermaceae bacterium RA]
MKNVNIARQDVYDAIVVGSGITGGWAAKELTEKGLRTLLLERGPYVEHGTDYVGEHKAPWELPFNGRGDRRLYEEEYPVQSTCYAFGPASQQFFVNDRKYPYTHDPDKPFLWIRGYHLGGRSLTWGRQSYRWSDLDFEANARDGFGVDWPIRYRDLAPWYDYVEDFAGISGQAEGLAQLPDGVFLPPMEMNAGEKVVKQGIEATFPDRRLTIGRVAVLTRNHRGRAACHYCGPCHRGCSAGAYFSSLSATLPAAQATGNLTIRCDSIVHSVIYDESRGMATGVRVIDRNTKETQEFHGRLVFLCASTLGTTQIMLNSTSRRFPEGIANDSGVLGRYLMDHPYLAGATGEIPDLEDRYYFGHRPNGIYIPRFRNLGDRRSAHSDFLRGYGYQGQASRSGWQRGLAEPGVGAELKQRLRDPGPWTMWIGGWGEHLPRSENFVDLDPEKTDEWGIPLLRIHCAWSDNEDRMRQDMATSAAEMLEAAGCRHVRPFIQDAPPGYCIHEMGTARMGKDPDTSVLNAYNQAHAVPNLFVTDGACMASSACQNPSLTYMALTARACNYAVEAMKRGDLRV